MGSEDYLAAGIIRMPTRTKAEVLEALAKHQTQSTQSSDSDQQPISTIIRPTQPIQTHQTEPSTSTSHPDPSHSEHTHSEPTQTEPQPTTSQDPEPPIRAIPESIAQDVIRTFPYRMTHDMVFAIEPLTKQPYHSPPQDETLILNLPDQPTNQTNPLTTSAPSSPTPVPEEGNLIPRRRRSIRGDVSGIRRSEAEAESSGVRAKIPLRTSCADEFSYLDARDIEEDRRAHELWQQQLAQNQKDLKEALRLAAEEGQTDDPLDSQASALQVIEKDKLSLSEQEKKWVSEKISMRKLSHSITSVKIRGERATKKRPQKVWIQIERSDYYSITHLVNRLEEYGYYEWLEIRSALKKVRSVYKRVAEELLEMLINRVSKATNTAPMESLVPDPPSSSRKRTPGRWTPNFIPPHPSGEVDWPRVDTSMLNLELPEGEPLTHGSIIQRPEFGIYFLNHNNQLRFQRVEEFSKAPTQHLINVLYCTSMRREDFISYGFGSLIRAELKRRSTRGEFIDSIHLKTEDPSDAD